MAILAGEIVSAGRLMRLQPAIYEGAATSSLAVTTTSDSDIPGATVTLTTLTDGASYAVTGIFDCNVTSTNATSLMVGRLYVDGSAVLGTSTYAMDTALRGTVAETWTGTLSFAGSHTLKLTGALNAASGGGSFLATNTKLVITIYEVV